MTKLNHTLYYTIYGLLAILGSYWLFILLLNPLSTQDLANTPTWVMVCYIGSFILPINFCLFLGFRKILNDVNDLIKGEKRD